MQHFICKDITSGSLLPCHLNEEAAPGLRQLVHAHLESVQTFWSKTLAHTQARLLHTNCGATGESHTEHESL